ncbi:MFS transporter [Bailinhaonella thermotolerans]|nr:MFS transporter [Bailinhaonella thermotolerans]
MADGIRAGRKEWTGLAVLLLACLLVSMDVSVLYFAVPFLSRELEPTATQQLWIFDVYGFVLSGLLITMGAVGDRIGRRRLLLIGAAAFGLASLAAAYSTSAEMLIAARAMLGVAGATLMPSTLALIRNLFLDDRQRGTAIGIWTGAMAGGVALGPVLSGFLLEHFWWGSVFLVNVPAMVLLLVLAPMLVPEFRPPAGGRFDLMSAFLSLAAVLPAVYGLKEIAAHGFGVVPAASIVAGLLVGVVFARRQGRRPYPMLDLALFRDRVFAGSIALNVLTMFAMAGMTIYTTQYLQSVLGLRPLVAALWSVLPSVAIAGVAPVAGALARRAGAPRVMSAGFLVGAVGLASMVFVGTDSALWMILVAATVYAGGVVTVMSISTEQVMAAAPPERAGTASAVMESGTEFGGALGMAVLGSVGAAIYRSQVPDTLPEPARETLGGAVATAAHLPADAARAVLAAAREAFTTGMHGAALTGAVILVAASAVTVPLLRRRPARPAARPEPRVPVSR